MVAGDNTGRYFLFYPEHWEAVFGSFPASTLNELYPVKVQRDGQVWQGTVSVWNLQATSNNVGIPEGLEHGRRDPISSSRNTDWVSQLPADVSV